MRTISSTEGQGSTVIVGRCWCRTVATICIYPWENYRQFYF
jgi:hypothetical protein